MEEREEVASFQRQDIRRERGGEIRGETPRKEKKKGSYQKKGTRREREGKGYEKRQIGLFREGWRTA